MLDGVIAILRFLLSEADFFVDGKDLQTLSARLPGRAFFSPVRLSVKQGGVWAGSGL
jgi:hypothetical protein